VTVRGCRRRAAGREGVHTSGELRGGCSPGRRAGFGRATPPFRDGAAIGRGG
jgi:hypothetical protein